MADLAELEKIEEFQQLAVIERIEKHLVRLEQRIAEVEALTVIHANRW